MFYSLPPAEPAYYIGIVFPNNIHDTIDISNAVGSYASHTLRAVIERFDHNYIRRFHRTTYFNYLVTEDHVTIKPSFFVLCKIVNEQSKICRQFRRRYVDIRRAALPR